MEEILHQLRLVIYPIIYRVFYIPGGCLGFLNHQQYPMLQILWQKTCKGHEAPEVSWNDGIDWL